MLPWTQLLPQLYGISNKRMTMMQECYWGWSVQSMLTYPSFQYPKSLYHLHVFDNSLLTIINLAFLSDKMSLTHPMIFSLHLPMIPRLLPRSSCFIGNILEEWTKTWSKKKSLSKWFVHLLFRLSFLYFIDESEIRNEVKIGILETQCHGLRFLVISN